MFKYLAWYLFAPLSIIGLIFYSQYGKSGGDIAFLLFTTVFNIIYFLMVAFNVKLKQGVVCSLVGFSITLLLAFLVIEIL